MNFAAKIPFKLAFALAFMGGFADAGSFVLNGVFSAHITGNAVLSFVYIASGKWVELWQSLNSLLFFLGGTVCGILYRNKLDGGGKYGNLKPLAVEFIFVVVSVFIMQFVSAEGWGPYLFIASLSCALGFQNGAYCKLYGLALHTTYISGQTTAALQAFLPSTKNAAAGDGRIVYSGIVIFFCLGAALGVLLTHIFGINGFFALPAILCAIILGEYLAARKS